MALYEIAHGGIFILGTLHTKIQIGSVIARGNRKRLLQIIRNVPADVMNADSKEYLQQTFETQDAAEARDLRRWYAARKITPPEKQN